PVACGELLTRRVGRVGVTGSRQTEAIPRPEGGAERLVLQWVLDLNGRGYLPGDTAYYRLRAYDNAPNPQMAETREYALRLPTLAEMREAVREASRALTVGVDSLVKTQTAVAQQTQERMIDQALTPELREQLAKARESLQRLDAQKARDVMQQLSESAQQLKERLEQSREMLRRAAIEGSMTTLASDAEDLAQRQKDWNERAKETVDSSMEN